MGECCQEQDPRRHTLNRLAHEGMRVALRHREALRMTLNAGMFDSSAVYEAEKESARCLLEYEAVLQHLQEEEAELEKLERE